MHDGLYQNQEVLGVPLFVALSEALDVTKQKLIHALKQQNFKAKIETDVMGGVRSGVSGTPAFLINGNRYRGAYDFNALAAAVRGYREADAHL
jgi:protein-disulfide isomerase